VDPVCESHILEILAHDWHRFLCGCWVLYVDPCGPRISMWTQFDDDDVSMTVTMTVTVTC
jgi:hypothetical protein